MALGLLPKQRYHGTEFMKTSSTSEELQRRLPSARVVKAFSTMPAQSLVIEAWKNNTEKPPIFLASDDKEAKEIVKQIAIDAGFQTFDAGELANARSIEQMGVLLHHVRVSLKLQNAWVENSDCGQVAGNPGSVATNVVSNCFLVAVNVGRETL